MPRRRLVSREVLTIEYVHVDDEEDTARFHEFSEGVSMYVKDDGSVVLERPDGKQLWDDFLEPDDDE